MEKTLAYARFVDRMHKRSVELELTKTSIPDEPYNVRLSVDDKDSKDMYGKFNNIVQAQALFNSLVRNFFNLCSYDEDNTK